MDSALFTDLNACLAVTQGTLKLLLYSHIPTALLVLFVGFFVLIKNKKDLASILLFSIAFVFALWSATDLIVWLYFYKIKDTMFVWSFFGIFYLLIYILSLYFFNVFVDKKDISFSKKILFFLILLPTLVLMPTKFNLPGFDATNCEAFEGNYYTNYYYLAGFVIFLWILITAFIKARRANIEQKKQIFLFTIGIEAFLFLFFSTGFLVSYLNDKGIIQNYNYELYGLFGMPIFMAFLAYLIVKFKAFNIKLLGAQALVVALVALIGSEFFFTSLDNTTSIILISVTVLLSVVFGIFLVESVKLEVQRKEELQGMSDKLSEANDQLRKLDNSKSEFISIASHQLRTPLTAIKGFVSLLLEGSYGQVVPKQQDVLNKVYTANERLVQLVEDLLNISRMESGRMEFKFAPWNISSICQEVMDTFMPRAKDDDKYLKYNKPEIPLPEVMIDGTKVREVISNMVDNALKYTPKGGVTLKVEQADASRYTPNKNGDVEDKPIIGPVIRVTVSDTGIGIPVTELPYLFAKFSRGKDVSRLNVGGTGLGLYVGRSMIENNGGKIWAESDGQGQGSRFIIEIPLHQSEELMERWG